MTGTVSPAPLASLCRGKRQSGHLFHGLCVHVKAHADCRAVLHTVQNTDHAGSTGKTFIDLVKIQALEMSRNKLARAKLHVGHFRMRVDISAPRDHLLGNVICFLNDLLMNCHRLASLITRKRWQPCDQWLTVCKYKQKDDLHQ